MRKSSKCFQPSKNLGGKKCYFSFLSGSLPIHILYFCDPVLLPKKPRKVWRALRPKLSRYSSRRGSSAHKTRTWRGQQAQVFDGEDCNHANNSSNNRTKSSLKHEESDTLFFLKTSCIYTRSQKRKKLFMCSDTYIYINTHEIIRTAKKVQEINWV